MGGRAGQAEAAARLARVVDDLRQAKGPLVVFRGHDLILRHPPVDASKPVPVPPGRKARGIALKSYVSLRAHSYYSFLDSTLSPADIVALAAQHGCPAVAMTDTGNLHGVVEFTQAAQKAGIKPLVGVELRVGKHPLLLYVQNAKGYENLCRLLSRQASRGDDESVAAKQQAPVAPGFLGEHSAGLLAVSSDVSLATVFGDRFYPAGEPGNILCNAVHYARPEDRRRYDIVQSIRTLSLLSHAHPAKRAGGFYHFRTPNEAAALAERLADRCDFVFPFGKPQFLAYRAANGASSRECLRGLAMDGLRRRYHGKVIRSDTGAAVPESEVRAQLETELSIIVPCFRSGRSVCEAKKREPWLCRARA